MGEVRDRAQLVDAAALGDRAIGVTIPRSQIEDVLRSDGTPELVLEMARRDNGDADTRSIHLDWNAQELEELLGRAEGNADLALLFDRDDIERLLDEDVEAHGLRERAAVLAVAATAATAAAAGHASAQPMVPVHDGGGAVAPIEMVSDAATSGPSEFAAGPSSLVSDAALSGARPTPAAPIQSASALEAVADAAAGSPQMVSDSASSGPTEFAAGPSSLVSDAALSGARPVPGAPIQSASALETLADTAANPTYVSLASAGSPDEGISMPSPATTGALAAGAALALSAAFVIRRRSADDNVRPA